METDKEALLANLLANLNDENAYNLLIDWCKERGYDNEAEFWNLCRLLRYQIKDFQDNRDYHKKGNRSKSELEFLAKMMAIAKKFKAKDWVVPPVIDGK